MEQYVKELRVRYEGIQDRLSDREIRIFDLMKYISNCQATDDRVETLKNLKRGKANHLAGSTILTNSMITNGNEIPELELREVENIIKKLEIWNFMHLPKFQIPLWSMNIYGGPKTNDWELLGEIYEMDMKGVRKIKIEIVR